MLFLLYAVTICPLVSVETKNIFDATSLRNAYPSVAAGTAISLPFPGEILAILALISIKSLSCIWYSLECRKNLLLPAIVLTGNYSYRVFVVAK